MKTPALRVFGLIVLLVFLNGPDPLNGQAKWTGAEDAGRPAGSAGHLDQRHDHAARAAGADGGQGVSHRRGSRGDREAARRRTAPRTDKTRPARESAATTEFWYDAGTKVLATRQTSLVVDPPDGRVPVKPSAEARRDDYARAQRRQLRVHEPVGSLHHARRARLDVSRPATTTRIRSSRRRATSRFTTR